MLAVSQYPSTWKRLDVPVTLPTVVGQIEESDSGEEAPLRLRPQLRSKCGGEW